MRSLKNNLKIESNKEDFVEHAQFISVHSLTK